MKRMQVEENDGYFLRWTADWLDKIDPLLAAIFANPKVAELYSKEEQDKLQNWLAGKEVQERLRNIAYRIEGLEK